MDTRDRPLGLDTTRPHSTWREVAFVLLIFGALVAGLLTVL